MFLHASNRQDFTINHDGFFHLYPVYLVILSTKLELGGHCVFCYVESPVRRMRVLQRTFPFRKTAACPASATLLSFGRNSLAVDAAVGVKDHLELCDFCNAELPLLAHHQAGVAGGDRPPELPINLRILAESLLGSIQKLHK
jgi:hypothetical protein